MGYGAYRRGMLVERLGRRREGGAAGRGSDRLKRQQLGQLGDLVVVEEEVLLLDLFPVGDVEEDVRPPLVPGGLRHRLRVHADEPQLQCLVEPPIAIVPVEERVQREKCVVCEMWCVVCGVVWLAGAGRCW